MKYFNINSNLRGIEIKPVEETEIYPCEHPEYFRNKKFKIYNRKWVPDIFGMNCIGYDVVSEKFKNVLEEHGFTGYKLIPIRIEGLPGGYFIFAETNVARNLTPADEDLDLYVSLKNLQKADVSRVDKTRVMVINEKVLNALKKAKIKNLRIKYFDNLSEDVAMKKFYQ